MEVEKAVSAAANLDTVVLTAKVGVAAAALKGAYDAASHLPDALKAGAAVALVAGAVALTARLAQRGAQQAAAPAAPAAVEQQQEAAEGSGGVGVGVGEAGVGAAEREEAGVRSG